jgi:hypothetical protein
MKHVSISLDALMIASQSFTRSIVYAPSAKAFFFFGEACNRTLLQFFKTAKGAALKQARLDYETGLDEVLRHGAACSEGALLSGVIERVSTRTKSRAFRVTLRC